MKEFTTNPHPARPYEPEPLSANDLAWHYCGPAALDSILSKHELWASSIAFMNDTTEALLGSEALRRRFDEEKAKLSKSVAARLERSLFDRDAGPGAVYGSDKFLLSASLDGDNLSMWRAYGANDVSYAIGIDPTGLLAPIGREEDVDPHPAPDYEAGRFIELDAGLTVQDSGWDASFFSAPRWFKAVYDPTRSEEIVASALEHLQQIAKKVSGRRVGELATLRNEISRAFVGLAIDERRDLAIFQIKHPGFVDEKEARLVLTVHPAWRFVQYRSSRLGFVPYVRLTSFDRLGLLGDYPTKGHHLPIRKVCVGPTRYPELAKAGLEGLLAKWGYHAVEVALSEIPFRPV